MTVSKVGLDFRYYWQFCKSMYPIWWIATKFKFYIHNHSIAKNKIGFLLGKYAFFHSKYQTAMLRLKKHLETFKLKIEQHEMENRKTAWIFIKYWKKLGIFWSISLVDFIKLNRPFLKCVIYASTLLHLN